MDKNSATETAPMVTILMGLHNGAAHLAAQLQTIGAQTHKSWRLICSDDGSSDETIEIIRLFSIQWPGRVTVESGPRAGFAANYLSLIRGLPPTPGYISFADQDDLWLPDKLSRGIDGLAATPQPTLYCGRLCYWYPNNGRQILSQPMRRPFTLRNALIENVATGNTILLNPNAAALARHAAQQTRTVFAHDWWLYLLLTGTGGRIEFDNGPPSILYRQHGENEIGAGHGIQKQVQRKLGVLQGLFSGRIDKNLAALEAIESMLTPQAREICQGFANARRSTGLARLTAFRRIALYRQNRAHTLGFWGAATLGRV